LADSGSEAPSRGPGREHGDFLSSALSGVWMRGGKTRSEEEDLSWREIKGEELAGGVQMANGAEAGEARSQ
jgi:hypothetical protein